MPKSKSKHRTTKKRGTNRFIVSSNTAEKMQLVLYFLWIAIVALTPLVAPFFRSYIGSGGPDNQAFYGYTPDLYMASWLQVSSILLLSLTAITVFLKQSINYFNTGLFWSILLFVGWATLSVSWSHNNYESFDKLSNWWASAAGLLLMTQLLTTKQQLLNFVGLIFVTAILVALMGMAQYLLGWDSISQAAPPAASFGNKNFAAQFSLMCLPLGLIILLSNSFPLPKNINIWLGSIGMALIAIYIVYTDARAAWISVIVEVIIITIWMFKERKQTGFILSSMQKKALLMAFSLFVLGIHFDRDGFNLDAVIKYTDRAQSVIEQADIDSGNKRIPMWINTTAQIRDYWFKGVGIGNWYVHYPIYQQSITKDQLLNNSVATRHTHNDLLQLISELGLVGFILILMIATYSFRIGFRLLKHNAYEIRLIAIIIGSAVVGLIVDSQFSSPLQRPMTNYLLIMFLGILLWLDFYQSDKSMRIIQLPSIISLIVLILCAYLSYISIEAHVRYQQSNANYWKAKTGNNQQDYKNTLLFSSIAYRQNPERKRLLNLVGGSQLLLKNYPQAILSLENARKNYPYMQHTLLNLSYAYERSNQFLEAIETMNDLLKTQPMNASHYVRIGKLWEKAGNRLRAIYWYKQALEKEDISARHKRQIENFLDNNY